MQTYFHIIDCNGFCEIHCVVIFQYKSLRKQISLLRKKVKGQPGVIIWTNLIVFECPMLYTKF